MATKREKDQRLATLRPHPVRDQIVDVMRSYGRPISPTRISRITGGSLGSVAYHVRTLSAAGVIELADEGRVRGAVEHLYALVRDDAPLADPVGNLLSICGVLTLPAPDGGYPVPASLDEAARRDLRAVIERIGPEVRQIVQTSTARTTS
jgi:DNA-binding transcriptional ArsR family regulator